MIVKKFNEELKRGMRVYQNLYNIGLGYIVSVDQDCNKNDTSFLAGVIASGGGDVHIVYENGTESKYPEALLRSGVQCGVCEDQGDGLASDEFLEKMLAMVEQEKQENADQEALKSKKHDEKCLSLQGSQEFQHLEIFNDRYAKPSSVAKNVRKDLKHHFKSCKFSVRTSNGSLYIEWTDGPTQKAVDELLKKYKTARFDSYTDYHFTESSAFNDVFGGVDYVFSTRKNSDMAIQKGIDFVLNQYDCTGIDVTLSAYHNGDLYRIELEQACDDVGRLINDFVRSKCHLEDVKPNNKATSKQFDPAVLASPLRTIHTKKGNDIFVVQVVERVSSETFKIMLEHAKIIGRLL